MHARVAFDCPYFVRLTPETSVTQDGDPRPTCVEEEDKGDRDAIQKNLKEMSVYAYDRCRLARFSYNKCVGGLGYRCEASCQVDNRVGDDGVVLVDDWEWDSG